MTLRMYRFGYIFEYLSLNDFCIMSNKNIEYNTKIDLTHLLRKRRLGHAGAVTLSIFRDLGLKVNVMTKVDTV